MTSGLPFITSPLLSRYGVVHGFSTRVGGVSSGPYSSLDLGGSAAEDPEGVETNHHRLADALGITRTHIATAKQIHGNEVVLARRRPGGVEIARFSGSSTASPSSPSSTATATSFDAQGDERTFTPSGSLGADALVASPGAAVGVRTADCVPILLFDPRSGLAAAIHAGWRGTVARVVLQSIEALRSLGHVDPGDLIAAIGPAIGRCCFEVSPELGARFEDDADFGSACVQAKPGSRPHVDLVEANARLLLSAGVARSAIDRLERCTHCDSELFFSHRRDKGTTGRHLSVIAARI